MGIKLWVLYLYQCYLDIIIYALLIINIYGHYIKGYIYINYDISIL